MAGSAVTLFSGAAQAQQPSAEGAEAQPADAQVPATPTEDEAYPEDEDTIVVTGQRQRGTVLGDIPPENVLDPAQIRATGASDISELLEAIAPQIGSARGRGGGRPIMLLNGQRISSFRELRDIPTEAIQRMEVLPEEVALKYGYRADQRVVNIVLRPRFRSTVARVEGTTSTEGGYSGGELDLTRLMIGQDSRTTIDLDVEANSPLTEADRDIVRQDQPGDGSIDPREARTLVGSRRQVTATATHNRTILGDVSATGNVELQHSEGRSLFGLDQAGLTPLARRSSTHSAHAGFALNGQKAGWRWSSTGNADLARQVIRSDRSDDASLFDRARSTTASADVDLTANGTVFALPAGDAGMTARIAASTLRLDSRRSTADDIRSTSLGRTRGLGALNVDMPISRRNSDFASLGNLTLNANAEVEQLSDFGTLATIGAGANWSPANRLNFITSWTREKGAPTVQQLGEPVLETPGTRVFDFTTGQTVLVTAVTGGNPDLLADRRIVFKLGANWQPLEETDLRLRAEYVRSDLDNPVSNFPGATAALEAAFPERFVRNAGGELVEADLRPVNYDSARRDTLRIGFDFSKPLKSAAPSPAQIESLRARRRQSDGAAGEAPPQVQGQEAPSPQRAEGPGGPGGQGGFGRFGGGRSGGRLTYSLTDTITLVDQVTIRQGLPKLDYLRGDAVGQSGGRPRHEIEARAGYFNNGLGARISANHRTGTEVDSASGDRLRFSPLSTFDLRLWANLGQRFDLVAKQPWLRGSSVRFEINNIFDSKPEVRNAAGDVPFSYQPDLLDPRGRTVSISFRKLFLPPRGAFRREEPQRR